MIEEVGKISLIFFDKKKKKILGISLYIIFLVLIFALIGMLIESYLFFIQAKHAVSLYYGENKV